MLGAILRDIFRRPDDVRASKPTQRRILNVGGHDKAIPIPAHYDGWEHLLLDIDPQGKPDIVCDACKLNTLEPQTFDAVYCSHNLEHYYPHDVPKVLSGFLHVLKPDGFAEITVPDILAVMQHLVQHNMDVDDVLYISQLGPISALDVIYGYGKEIEKSGNDFWAHKTGFTPKRLDETLKRAGFVAIHMIVDRKNVELKAFAFKSEPTALHAKLLALT